MAIGINNKTIGQSNQNKVGGMGGVAAPDQTKNKRTDDFDIDDLYSYFDRSKKTVSDFILEYQNVSNFNYYRNLGNRLDYRYKLIDLYEYAMLDLHLTSIVDSLFHQIIGERYTLKNPDGTTNKEASKLIKNSWFVQYIRGIIESKLFGYSLMELGELNKSTGTLKEVRQIERRNVAPKNNLVLEQPHDSTGWDITSEELAEDYVMIDGQEGYGWLLKAIPVVMSKRFALSSHTQYAETYGIPMIVGKTTDDSYEEKKDLANEIAAARDSRVIVTGIEDDITFLNQISNDTNKIYTELVRLTNDELTMLILGQSATTESQAYVGSAEIQYRVMVDRVEAIREFVTNHINEDLLWRLRDKGMAIPKDVTFCYSNVMEMSPESKKDLFDVLLRSYEIDAEEIEDTFGVKVGRQILEESNDQLLEYGEETIKERGNPDKTTSKDPEQAAKDASDVAKAKKILSNEGVESMITEDSFNFFDTEAGCDFDSQATDMQKSLRKLSSRELSKVKIVNDVTETYSSYHSHKNDVSADLGEDLSGFIGILEGLYSRMFAGDRASFSEAHEKLTQMQYDRLSEIFTAEYGVSLEAILQDAEQAGYSKAVSDFYATFSASKQHQLLKIISTLTATYQQDYNTFIKEARKANSLFNKTYHVVEGEVMEAGYAFAKVWRSESNENIIFEYTTVGDKRVRANHSALEGIRMRKSEWATSGFLPPWAYGCRCTLINTGSTNGQILTKNRKLPSEDIVPAEFRTNVGVSGAVFSRQHPYYKGLTQSDAVTIRQAISNVNR
jgi:hypothetical protein